MHCFRVFDFDDDASLTRRKRERPASPRFPSHSTQGLKIAEILSSVRGCENTASSGGQDPELCILTLSSHSKINQNAKYPSPGAINRSNSNLKLAKSEYVCSQSENKSCSSRQMEIVFVEVTERERERGRKQTLFPLSLSLPLSSSLSSAGQTVRFVIFAVVLS